MKLRVAIKVVKRSGQQYNQHKLITYKWTTLERAWKRLDKTLDKGLRFGSSVS